MTGMAVSVGFSTSNFLRNPSSADIRRHLPLKGRFLGAPKDERTTATAKLPTTNQVGYSMSVMNPLQLEQYNRVRGSSAEHATDGPKSR